MELSRILLCSILQILVVSGATLGTTPLGTNQRTENTKVDRSLKTSGNWLEPYAGMDPRSCRCLPGTKQCKISLAKSSLLEVRCPENHNYCCDDDSGKGIQPEVVETDKSLDTSDKDTQRPHGRVRIRLPTEETMTLPANLDPTYSSRVMVKPQQIRCNCKARDNCEDKYTDYTFGFHCSYDKVRCCEPQDQIVREMNEGRLITPLRNEPTTPGTSYQCQCVSLEQCLRLNLNVVRSGGKDDLCPFRFVKCCGISITKKSDTDVDMNASLEDEVETGRGMGGIDMHGQPAFRQPIQLPIIKIPVSDTAMEVNGNSPTFSNVNPGGQAEVIQSPPELPHSYHQVPDHDLGRAGIPSNFYQEGVQRPPVRQYYGGVSVGPSMHENPAPVPYRTVNVNGPVGIGGRYGGRPESPSFMEAISNFFFG